MIEYVKWLFLLLIIGWISFPISFHIFKKLPTRGYGIAKILALLIWGYLFWIGNIFSIINNSGYSSLIIILIILSLSILVVKKSSSKSQIISWISTNWKLIVFTEIIFLFFSLIMLFLRGASPQIIGTEKPMELMFINGVSKSNKFPPSDPWLSGYSISYYYFGYVIINVIVKILGTPTGIAFNLALIFWFALIASGSSDLAINLLTNQKHDLVAKGIHKIAWRKLFISLIAPFLILIVSNSEGFLELIHSLGGFWNIDSGGSLTSRFWSWIDIKELVLAPPQPFDWDINRIGGTWWWRASRVLQDYALDGSSREVIDEFPFFSFFLGDLHPHVLAIPFVVLSISLGLNIFNSQFQVNKSKKEFIFSTLRNVNTWVIAFIVGSLIFLNTWDFPIYFGLIALVIIYKTYQSIIDLKISFQYSVIYIFILGVISLLLYSPFLLGFASQAGGLLPSLVYQSRSVHLAVMFLPLLIPVMIYQFFYTIPRIGIRELTKSFIFSFGVYIILILLSFAYVFAHKAATSSVLSIYGASSEKQLIIETVKRIISDPFDVLLLIAFISSGISFGLSSLIDRKRSDQPESINLDVFYGILLIIASGLILFPEIFYLRDQFGWRMNTIFKFYFQAWILLSICASYSIYKIFISSKKFYKIFATILILVGIVSGVIYPFYAIKERFVSIKGNGIEIDGTAYLNFSNPGESEAIAFLNTKKCGIIAEAIGGSYSNYGRVSKLTGCQTVLGWPGHEMQWRGSGELLGSRESDISTLYKTNDWFTAKEIMDRYEIKYIFVGPLELNTYNVNQAKFDKHLLEIFKNDSVTIYFYL